MRGGVALLDAIERHPTGHAEAGVAVDIDVRESLLQRVWSAEAGNAEYLREILPKSCPRTVWSRRL